MADRRFPFVTVLAAAALAWAVIAYPKTAKAQCLMSETPSPVDPHQLLELGIGINKKL